MAQSKSSISDKLFSTVETSLKNKDTLSIYKTNIDRYLANNTDKYFGMGPGERPIYSTTNIDDYISLLGLTSTEIKNAIKESSNVNSSWFMLKPYNIANILATRHFLMSKNDEYLTYTVWYLIVELYPPLHFRYFKYNVNPACMQYTINNLSGKFNIKKAGNLWNLLSETCMTAIDLHKNNLIEGNDISFVKYVQDIQSRLNNLLKNIARKYYDNYENKRFLKEEKESFEEDSYYEADSNSYAIERVTNKVVTHLMINGPDYRLVELSAKTNKVSVNQLRNYTDAIVSDEKYKQNVHDIIEAILFLYLFNEDGNESHGSDTIGTNEFMIHCLQSYKKSNTKNKQIVKIKEILDIWLDDVGLTAKTTRAATVVNFRKAIYTFFVMEIQKIA